MTRAWRLAIAAAAITGLGINTVAYETVMDSLTSFTQQSNLMVAAYFLWQAARPSPRREFSAGPRPLVRGAVTQYIVITGIVYSLLLADGWDSYGLGDTLAHVVVPVAVLADWVLVGTSQALVRAWYPVAWLSYLFGYLTVVLIRGAMTDRYPYYFLNADSVGTGGLISYIGAFLVGFTVLGYLISAAGRLKRFQQPDSAVRT
jgi:hypothetical protein